MPSGSAFGPPYRIHWCDQARADIRRLDRAAAMRIFDGVLHFARAGGGDLMSLQGDLTGSLRLRIGDYRVLFNLDQNTMSIFGVRHRSEAYRK
jgi:mRNA interferase RelE/StbE